MMMMAHEILRMPHCILIGFLSLSTFNNDLNIIFLLGEFGERASFERVDQLLMKRRTQVCDYDFHAMPKYN